MYSKEGEIGETRKEVYLLQFVTVVLAHQATAQDTREKGEQLALVLAGKLDGETAVAAQKEGAMLTFAQTAGRLVVGNGDGGVSFQL